MKFEIRKSKKVSTIGLYYYVLIGRNGEVMLVSEMMTRKESCRKSIRSIKRSVGLWTKVVDATH